MSEPMWFNGDDHALDIEEEDEGIDIPDPIEED